MESLRKAEKKGSRAEEEGLVFDRSKGTAHIVVGEELEMLGLSAGGFVDLMMRRHGTSSQGAPVCFFFFVCEIGELVNS